MKYFSLFSGIGGFELGIQQAYVDSTKRSKNRKSQKDSQTDAKDKRFLTTRNETARAEKGRTGKYDKHWHKCGQPHCVGYSEIDKYAIQIYQRHFPEHKNYGDITKIKTKELPDFDLIVGGFPCQSFSIAGKRRGFEDTRGTLFFEIARILKEKRPRLLLLENVKGLLSHDNGRTFKVIITTLVELGYDLQWQVLNSKNFGVPQNRERVFIVGHLRGTPRPQVFPIGTSNQINDSVRKDQDKERPRSSCLNTRYGQRWTDETYIGIQQINNPKHSNDRVYKADGVAPTLNTMQGGRRQPKILQSTKIRRLTPTECERLQGFPDEWTLQGLIPTSRKLYSYQVYTTQTISDTQRYKCLGNAVTTNVICEIVKRMVL